MTEKVGCKSHALRKGQSILRNASMVWIDAQFLTVTVLKGNIHLDTAEYYHPFIYSLILAIRILNTDCVLGLVSEVRDGKMSETKS
jgi:hypothetical protein